MQISQSPHPVAHGMQKEDVRLWLRGVCHEWSPERCTLGTSKEKQLPSRKEVLRLNHSGGFSSTLYPRDKEQRRVLRIGIAQPASRERVLNSARRSAKTGVARARRIINSEFKLVVDVCQDSEATRGPPGSVVSCSTDFLQVPPIPLDDSPFKRREEPTSSDLLVESVASKVMRRIAGIGITPEMLEDIIKHKKEYLASGMICNKRCCTWGSRRLALHLLSRDIVEPGAVKGLHPDTLLT
ncbi:hypothetical protein CC1G_13666 [Coprinopsis cinerea okayama7|uniref:Uncharacterized protein n=1 Tax=Coprinopsis cinerea (strain Okayama-7 / 130 / ATCC MYA-4618 / FGSC 9003) TaxID=240176 RepID=D6RJT3_COPC7|nr:hypothetical protein CC1G_13666 [Coprinopsis cinerea okayama7\|eukprot:XP_002912134.1 hypothetical protein CC1G_13666 [Coprinopsis cinerea okayama7\